MKVTEDDLKLSSAYQEAIKEAEVIAETKKKSKKKELSNKIEAELFLKNKQLIKDIIQYCPYPYDALFNYIKKHFNLTNKEAEKLLAKAFWFNTESKIGCICISMSLFIPLLTLIDVLNLNMTVFLFLLCIILFTVGYLLIIGEYQPKDIYL